MLVARSVIRWTDPQQQGALCVLWPSIGYLARIGHICHDVEISIRSNRDVSQPSVIGGVIAINQHLNISNTGAVKLNSHQAASLQSDKEEVVAPGWECIACVKYHV